MLLRYIRDNLVEQEHEGYVYSYSKGFISQKETDTPYYLRSCAKPLQASLLINFEVDKKFNFGLDEIALCCASHTGEQYHIDIANSILNKTGLSKENIKCGIHQPLSDNMKKILERNNQSPNVLHNNCSGKHLMFLAVSKANNWSLDNYYDIDHPVQQKTAEIISDLCEINVFDYPITTDGCGVPIYSMPLKNIVKGYLNLFLDEKYEKIKNAYLRYPKIIGGENRLDTIIIENGKENLVAKVGADGLCVVVNLAQKDAFIVKINDCSETARKIVVLETLKRLNWADIEYDNTIKTLSGKNVGYIQTELKI